MLEAALLMVVEMSQPDAQGTLTREPLQSNSNWGNLISGRASDHACSRFCTFTPLFGNVWQCQSSGCVHVCDSNCDQVGQSARFGSAGPPRCWR